MTAEADIAAISDGGENTALDVRTALTSVLARADSWNERILTRPGGTHDDEFLDPSLSGNWTAVTPSGTAAWEVGHGLLSAKVAGQTAQHLAALLRSIGDLEPPVTIEAAGRMLGHSSNFNFLGVCFTDGITGTSNVVVFAPYFSTGNLIYRLQGGTLSNANAVLHGSDVTIRGEHLLWIYMRLTWVSVDTWHAEISPNGVHWTDYGKGNFSHTLAPTHMGLVASSWGHAQDRIASFEYFRVV